MVRGHAAQGARHFLNAGESDESPLYFLRLSIVNRVLQCYCESLVRVGELSSASGKVFLSHYLFTKVKEGGVCCPLRALYMPPEVAV